MSNRNAKRIKLTRRWMLESLELMYPTPLTMRTLFDAVLLLDEIYDIDLLKKDITYFKDKGWLRFIDISDPPPSFIDRVVSLTAAGKEIAERTINDPALEEILRPNV